MRTKKKLKAERREEEKKKELEKKKLGATLSEQVKRIQTNKQYERKKH